MPRAVGIRLATGEQVALTPGKAATFTLGADMMEGESKTVTWSATNADGTELRQVLQPSTRLKR